MPSALASKWITDTWDQNPAMHVLSPIASKIESVVVPLDFLQLQIQTLTGQQREWSSQIHGQ